MIGAILTELESYLNQKLITEVGENSHSRCAVVKIGSLQDDPTRQTPYCLITHKESVAGWPGHMPNSDTFLGEVGGSQFWTHVFTVRVVSYSAQQLEVIDDIDTLRARLFDALGDNQTLGTLQFIGPTHTERLIGIENTVVPGFTSKVRGGDNDWFGEVSLDVHYHSIVS